MAFKKIIGPGAVAMTVLGAVGSGHADEMLTADHCTESGGIPVCYVASTRFQIPKEVYEVLKQSKQNAKGSEKR